MKILKYESMRKMLNTYASQNGKQNYILKNFRRTVFSIHKMIKLIVNALIFVQTNNDKCLLCIKKI